MQHDDARGYFQGRFSRIFVDEFQDTDPVKAEVLLLLAAGDAASVTGGRRLRGLASCFSSAIRSSQSIAFAAPM
jgi:superfamily I DNA/RNA helicase